MGEGRWEQQLVCGYYFRCGNYLQALRHLHLGWSQADCIEEQPFPPQTKA